MKTLEDYEAEIAQLKQSLAEKDAEVWLLESEKNMAETRLEIVTDACMAASIYRDVDNLLESFLKTIVKALKADGGSFLLLNEKENKLEFRTVIGEKAQELKRYSLRVGEGIAGWVAKTGEPAFVSDPSLDKRWQENISLEIGYPTDNIIAVPLKASGRIVGVLELVNRPDSQPFTKNELNLLLTFANQFASTVDRAQLIEKLEAQLSAMEMLAQISTAVSSSLNLKSVLDIVLESSIKTLRTEAGSILLKEEGTDFLTFYASSGGASKQLEGLKLKLGQGIAGWVAEKGEPLLVQDVKADPRFTPDIDQQTHFETRSALCVPLKIKDKIVGSIEVLNRQPGDPFTEEELKILSILADNAAVAIENAKLYNDLEELFLATVKTLTETIDAKDPYTHGHSERVAKFSMALAREFSLGEKLSRSLELSALFHDIGKIGVDENVLRKTGELNPTEWEEMRKHPAIGAKILGEVKQLKDILPGIRYHHERFDGKGYPDKLAGDQIHLLGRIISVADALDAMTSERPYRRALSNEDIVTEFRKNTGKQFDPKVVTALASALKKGEIHISPRRKGSKITPGGSEEKKDTGES